MTDNTNPNTAAALRAIIEEIQYLIDHPRIQQRRWVASGKKWLPVLEIVHGELSAEPRNSPSDRAQAPRVKDLGSILVEVNISVNQTFVNIDLADVSQVEVHHTKTSSFTLKDGRKYLTSPKDAQRIIDAIRKAQGEDKA